MAHGGCACHSSLPRHPFHSLSSYHSAEKPDDSPSKSFLLPEGSSGLVNSSNQDFRKHNQDVQKHGETAYQEPSTSPVALHLAKRPDSKHAKIEGSLSELSEETSSGLLSNGSATQLAKPDIHYGCRHGPSVRILDIAEDLLTIIPAALDEVCFQVPTPVGTESLGEKMRAILCASHSAALYCTPARRGGTVYWIAQTSLPVNERAVRATGVAGISGDAVLIENKEYGPLQLAAPSQQESLSSCEEMENSPLEYACPDVQHDKGFLEEAKNGKDGSVWTGQPLLQSDCSHKRGLSKGLLSSLEGGIHTGLPRNCSPSEAGDPLMKRPRQAEVEGQLLKTQQAVEVDSAVAAASKDRAIPMRGVENIHKDVENIHKDVGNIHKGVENIHKDTLERALREPSLSSAVGELDSPTGSSQALPIATSLGSAGHQLGGCARFAVQIDCNALRGSSSERCAFEAESRSIDRLSVGELQTVFSYLAFSDLSTASGVCKLWRASIAEDEPLLKNLRIRRRMFQPLNAPSTTNRSRFHTTSHPLPFVLLRAAEVSNVPAMVLVAEEMDRQGNRTKALEWFKKAARKGDQASQYRIGEAYYRGHSDWPQDGEEALIWLSRAAKVLNGDKRICGAAGLLLGYMHLDGEGIAAADNTEAVRWFRFAADMGNREAEKTVGWLWNTGQF